MTHKEKDDMVILIAKQITGITLGKLEGVEVELIRDRLDLSIFDTKLRVSAKRPRQGNQSVCFEVVSVTHLDLIERLIKEMNKQGFR